MIIQMTWQFPIGYCKECCERAIIIYEASQSASFSTSLQPECSKMLLDLWSKI